MPLEQLSLKSARILIAVGLLLTLAAGSVLAVLTEIPAAPREQRPYAGAPATSAPRADGSSIDHAGVNRDDLEASPASPELSVAAYGS
jgi:hypothetical protein